ncbi:molybdopterin-dependent oxidoreductase [Cellulomonas aerilata]|uniref:Oxidoreductase n=1 Tax=Cellulomonas aerilata TaxID=515326 RepID=A0A512DF65_9CELL|nr:molybdopterin-dependent oxidoreductase [Cellulomonas aerilata]GEO35118.1 oxidoreductase [Cellulomonas aerilata]
MSPPRSAPGTRRLAALAGVLAAGVTLGVSSLAAAVVQPASAPLVAVGDAFIDVTPGWLKDAAIAVFDVHDKTALVVGMVLVLTVLAAGAGVIALRNHTLGTVGVVLLGTVGAVSAASRADAGQLAVVPSLAGTAAGVVALRALVDRLDPAPRPARDGAPDVTGPTAPDRRSFLNAAMVVTALAALSAAAGSVGARVTQAAGAARELLRLPAPARPAAAVPAGAQSPAVGVVDVVTPNDDFYRIDTALVVPQVDPSTWTLRVHGLVEREVTMTFAELLAADLVETYVTLACVSNPVGGDLVGNARWLGLPIREVLARAVPLPGADMVLSTSVDGFTASTPLAALTDDRDALLAVGMNGEPLPLAHGFPVRMVVPGLYGYVSATKWVTDLEVTRFADQEAYWTVRGWSAEGPIKTSSRIEVPRHRASVPAGAVTVGGTAWAQHTGITGVEVQVDEGEWQPVALAAEISVDTWRQWSWSWDAEPGSHTLRVRATDATGEAQTGDRQSMIPDGATGWHEVTVQVSA